MVEVDANSKDVTPAAPVRSAASTTPQASAANCLQAPRANEYQELESTWTGCCEPDGYGELSRHSVDTLFQTMGITSASPTGAFFDLGSGVGKIVMHSAIAGFAKHAVGIELNDGRHRAALSLLETVRAENPQAAEAITLLNADMLEVDLSKATVLYLNQ